MPRFTYTVEVDADSQELADMVIEERVGYDECYADPSGETFDYRIRVVVS